VRGCVWPAVAPAEAAFPRWGPALFIGLSAGIIALITRPPLAWLVVAALVAVPIAWHAFVYPRHWPVLFCAAAILLPPVPFPIGDSGAHASVLLAGVGVLAGLARVWDWRIDRSVLNGAFVTFLGAIFASVGFALLYSGVAIALASAARAILLTIGIYVYFISSQGPARQMQEQAERTSVWIFWIAVVAALFGCIDFVYQLPAPAGFGAQFIWLDSGVYRRAQGLFYDASALGNFSAFFLVMSVVALVKKNVLRPSVACCGAVLFLGTLLLSYSRAAMGAAIVSLMALSMLERKRWASGYKVRLAATGLGLATLIVFAVARPDLAYSYWARVGVGWDAFFANPDRVLSGRLDHWTEIGSFITDHPWQSVFGIGYKTLPYTEHLGKPVIADNMYLSALVETGVVGLAALLALNAAVIAAAYRAARRGSFFGTWMFCFWTGEVFQMLAGDVLTFWRVLPVYFWVLAQAVGGTGPARQSPSQETSKSPAAPGSVVPLEGTETP
jgi:O-antigen ligase